jgi:hypothetical protein
VSARERLVAFVVSAVVIGAVLWPLTWDANRDSFPLSSYPMFAHGRRSAELRAVYAVATDARGERRYVPPRLVANREVLQARAVLDRAGRGGRKGAALLCGEIAGRIAADGGGGPFADAIEVRIIRGRHDAGVYFDSGALGSEKVLASCPIEGRR